ncbi:MAG: gamma-glutamyltransferase [Acidimicrobiia bacterium]
MHIYHLGGNAVDAAIAANAVQGVVAPETCGIGGDLFALVHRSGDAAPAALNASGRAGSGVDPAALRSAGHSSIPPFDPATVTIPGCVDGWSALSARFGSMPLADLLAPAIEHAEQGFAPSAEFTSALTRRADQLAPQAPELYPPQDTIVRREALAATLRQIAGGGRSNFYDGPAGIAITLAAPSISMPDLAIEQAEWVDPISANVFGRTGWTVPPNSQGYLTLASSWVFSETHPPADPDDPDYVHLQIEAYRSVAWERDDLVSDPRRSPLPADHLAAPDRLRDRVGQIDRTRAGTWPRPGPAPGGTAYLCFVDRSGMAVSLIQSNYMGIGSGIAAPSTGFFLHNRGAGFNLIEGHPNELTPGARPLHTLSPSLWTNDGALDTVLGTRGGAYQPQLLLQVAAASLFVGDEPETALRRPRWVLDGDEVRLEGSMSDGIVVELARRGHRVTLAGNSVPGWGPVSMISVTPDGSRRAAADPRVATTLALVDR